MARSRRDLAILARIGAKFRNCTPTYPHPGVFALGKVADFAPGVLGILRIAALNYCGDGGGIHSISFYVSRLDWSRVVAARVWSAAVASLLPSVPWCLVPCK